MGSLLCAASKPISDSVSKSPIFPMHSARCVSLKMQSAALCRPNLRVSFFLLHLRMQMNSFHCRSSTTLTDCAMNTLMLLYVSHFVPLFLEFYNQPALSLAAIVCTYCINTFTPVALPPSYEVINLKCLHLSSGTFF